MAEIYAIGNKNFVSTFLCVGSIPLPCSTREDLIDILKLLKKKRTQSMIFIAHSTYQEYKELIEEFREESSNIILVLPESKKDIYVGFDEIKNLIELSTGANLLGDYKEEDSFN